MVVGLARAPRRAVRARAWAPPRAKPPRPPATTSAPAVRRRWPAGPPRSNAPAALAYALRSRARAPACSSAAAAASSVTDRRGGEMPRPPVDVAVGQSGGKRAVRRAPFLGRRLRVDRGARQHVPELDRARRAAKRGLHARRRRADPGRARAWRPPARACGRSPVSLAAASSSARRAAGVELAPRGAGRRPRSWPGRAPARPPGRTRARRPRSASSSSASGLPPVGACSRARGVGPSRGSSAAAASLRQARRAAASAGRRRRAPRARPREPRSARRSGRPAAAGTRTAAPGRSAVEPLRIVDQHRDRRPARRTRRAG